MTHQTEHNRTNISNKETLPMKNPVCTKCFYYFEEHNYTKSGSCRFNAPVVAVDGDGWSLPPWPIVEGSGYCGQFKEKSEAL
jgi:hypothetical protein